MTWSMIVEHIYRIFTNNLDAKAIEMKMNELNIFRWGIE